MRSSLYLQRLEDSKKQDANLDTSFREKIERVCFIVTQRVRRKPKRRKFGPFKCRSALQKCRMVLLDAEYTFVFGCILDSLSMVFLSDPCTQTCFHPQSMIFISFLDNSGFFRNNYLLEKYPKINFDKVQIIHNFIVIQ